MKKLPLDRIPTWKEILNTDQFNRLTYKDMGRIIYRGTDEEGNKVFSVGRGTSKVLLPCLKNLITLLHSDCGLNEKIIFTNMTPTVTFPMTVGGFLSRGLGIHFIGVPLLLIGSQRAYREILRVVERTKELAKTINEPVLVLFDNRQ